VVPVRVPAPAVVDRVARLAREVAEVPPRRAVPDGPETDRHSEGASAYSKFTIRDR
jgi:hypothetical protein